MNTKADVRWERTPEGLACIVSLPVTQEFVDMLEKDPENMRRLQVEFNQRMTKMIDDDIIERLGL